MTEHLCDTTDTSSTSETLLEKLLEGGCVCEVSAPEEFRWLSKEANADTARRMLANLGRRLRQTEDGKAYYCGLLHLRTAERRNSIKRQLATTVNSLEPMVRWLALVMTATQSSSTLSAGNVVRVSELQTIIESTPALSEELDRITKAGVFKTTKDSDGDRLGAVISKLVEDGYLVSTGGRSSHYIATGKWSYLYEVIDFIVEHEQIPEEEASPEEQRELGL